MGERRTADLSTWGRTIDAGKASRFVGLAAAIAVCAPSSVAAQTQTPATASAAAVADEGPIADIVVTARKRSAAESAQTVPIALTALSGEQVAAMFATTLTDVGLTTPNANLAAVGTLPNVANFVIRGTGTTGQSIPSADPAVGVLQDGVPLGTIFGVVTNVFDLETIEILRGPQGTLFGRNVTGGAIVLRSNRPTTEFDGKVQATVGSYERYDLNLLVRGPLSDSVGAKLAVLSANQGGLYRNLTLGGRQGKQNSILVRPALSFDSGDFDAIVIGEFGDVTGDGPSTRNVLFRGVTRDPYADRTTIQSTPGRNSLRWYAGTLEVNQTLGDGALTGVFGYRELRQRSIADVDGAPFAVRFEFGPGTGLDQHQTSAELRWSGDLTERLNLTVGANFFDQAYTYSERRGLVDALDQRGRSRVDHRAWGVFAQGDFDLTPTLALTLGGRYTWENKKAAIGVIGDPGATGLCRTAPAPFTTPIDFNDCRQVFNNARSWRNFSPKAGVNWTVADEVLAYASFTRGFRSGGYNVRFSDTTLVTRPNNPLSTPGPYDPEEVDAYEVGLKSTFLDRRARVNLAAFHNKFRGLQRTALNANGGQQTLNAASGTVQGVEIDLTLAPTDNFRVQGAYGYVRARYDSFDFIANATGLPVEDLRFVMVPANTISASATWLVPLAEEQDLEFRGAYSFTDKTVADDFQRVALREYSLLDASISFIDRRRDLKLSAFGRNLTNEVYFNFGFDNSASAIGTKTFVLTPPRTFGLELTLGF